MAMNNANAEFYSIILEDMQRLKDDTKAFIVEIESRENKSISGIICPKCKSKNNNVIDSRIHKDTYQKRRRQCNNCGKRWDSIEIIYYG